MNYQTKAGNKSLHFYLLISGVLLTANPVSNAFADNQTVASDYCDLITQYEQQYGVAQLDSSDKPTGLCFLKLVDFNKDENDELLLIHQDESQSTPIPRYLFEVWTDIDGDIEQLGSGSLYSTNGGTQKLYLTDYDNSTYLVSGSCDDFFYNYYYGFSNGAFGQVREAIRDAYICTVNGENVSQDKWQRQEDLLQENMKCYFSNIGTEKDLFWDACQEVKDALGCENNPASIDANDTSGSDESISLAAGGSAPASDFIFPYSSSEYLTQSDLDSMKRDSVEGMRLVSQRAINEILARYGYVFKGGDSNTAQDAYNYFNSKDWYLQIKGLCAYSDPNNLIAHLNEVEKANIALINDWQIIYVPAP